MANGNDQYNLREQQRSKRGVVKLDPNEMETAMDLMGLSPDLMNAALESAGSIYDTRFGQDQPAFSEEDQRALDTLQGRAKQLQPADVPAPIQGLLPGNPYAVNFRGLSQGLQNLVGAAVNANKAAELYGDPDKVESLTDSMGNKLQKARELRQMAEALELAGPAVAPGFDSSKTVNELIADAEALEEKAARDAEAAEESRGVLQKVRRLEEDKAEAKQAETQRAEFIRKFGEETYSQALQAEREGRQQQAITGRAQLQQQALTDRLQKEIQGNITEARIKAWAAVQEANIKNRGRGQRAPGEEPDWPIEAEPKYMQKFIPDYLDPIEDRMRDLQKTITGKASQPLVEGTTMYNVAADRDPELMAEYEQLREIKDISDEVQLNAVTFENLKDQGYKAKDFPTHAATPEERQQLVRMKQWDMPPEMIEAYKFYNGISLNKAPQGPGQEEQGRAPQRGFSDIFGEQPVGTGTVLRNEEQ